MQFKNPEVLYALFLLIIPILVHLFQLRRFKKTRFSNVAFLQAVSKNTRKSSQIKKWLILFTRLLALAAVILAFAQPYLPQSASADRERETVLFLDNSFSMQAKGTKGPLLTEAVQDILSSFPENENFSLLTHSEDFSGINTANFRNALIDIDYAPTPLSAQAILLKAKNQFSSNSATLKRLVIISDFQDSNLKFTDSLSEYQHHLIQLKPVNYSNFSIDSLILKRESNDYELKVMIYSNLKYSGAIPISLFNGKKLIAKAAATFEDSQTAATTFRIAADNIFKGKLTINDPSINFDNVFYFSLNKPNPLKVLAVNNTSDDFLKRLYPTPEFEYKSVSPNQLDFSIIPDQNVIVLNELQNVSSALVNALQSFSQNGGQIVLIPNIKAKALVYDNLLNSFGINSFSEKSTGAKLVTSINYDHPIYDGVFEKRVTNFQYPSVSQTFRLNTSDALLSLEDGTAFLTEKNNLYVFSTSLNDENSNFKNSPLIVPTFYNIARAALSLPKIYYTLGAENKYDVNVESAGDNVISLSKDGREIVPLQTRQGGKITLSTEEGLNEDGIYEIIYEKDTLATVAYNYDRKESKLPQIDLKSNENANIANSVASVLDQLQQASNLNLIYKWFIIFAVLFLLLEMLILKFFK